MSEEEVVLFTATAVRLDHFDHVFNPDASANSQLQHAVTA
jgi:hypothetical protein